jgi:hypothetical protein
MRGHRALADRPLATLIIGSGSISDGLTVPASDRSENQHGEVTPLSHGTVSRLAGFAVARGDFRQCIES